MGSSSNFGFTPVYNWNTGQYTLGGQNISFSDAISWAASQQGSSVQNYNVVITDWYQIYEGGLWTYLDTKVTFEENNRSYSNYANQGGGGTPDWANITLGAAGSTAGYFEVGYLSDAKQVFKYGQRIDGKVRSAATLTKANRISSLSTAKNFSRVGTGLSVLSGLATVYDAYDKGQWQNHHTADLLINGGFYLVAGSFPVVGWIAGGAYFIADMTTQYYTGKSITQSLFDQ